MRLPAAFPLSTVRSCDQEAAHLPSCRGAISGTRNDLTFYSRCNFVPKPNGTMHCVYLEYPEREERAWDGIVTRISRSLGAPELKAEGR